MLAYLGLTALGTLLYITVLEIKLALMPQKGE
jgi:hypothetical protein